MKPDFTKRKLKETKANLKYYSFRFRQENEGKDEEI